MISQNLTKKIKGNSDEQLQIKNRREGRGHNRNNEIGRKAKIRGTFPARVSK